MAKVLVKVDKNGTKVYKDDTCTKCGGKGKIWMYGHVQGGTCFKCGGTGFQPKFRTVKEYTPEYAAILEERRQARYEKKLEEARAKAPEVNAEFFVKNGFDKDGYTFVVLGNTYEIKEELKELGAKFNNILGWHLGNDNDSYKTLMLHADDVYNKNIYGYYEYSDYKENVFQKIKDANLALVKKESKSEYIAEVGEKITINAKYVRTNWFDTQFGTTYVYTFKDENENVIVWKTGKYLYGIEETESVEIKGTVKDHNEYNGVKQTILTRCKIK